MSECGTGLVERADVRLNEVWKKVYPRLHNPRAKAELLEAQRLWIKYKDESCQFYAGSDFGSAGNSIAGPACRARVINDRTELLEQIVCKDEGEVSCL